MMVVYKHIVYNYLHNGQMHVSAPMNRVMSGYVLNCILSSINELGSANVLILTRDTTRNFKKAGVFANT